MFVDLIQQVELEMIHQTIDSKPIILSNSVGQNTTQTYKIKFGN